MAIVVLTTVCIRTIIQNFELAGNFQRIKNKVKNPIVLHKIEVSVNVPWENATIKLNIHIIKINFFEENFDLTVVNNIS